VGESWNSTAVLCLAGSHQRSAARTACVLCAPDTYSATAGATACAHCAKNMVSDVGASSCRELVLELSEGYVGSAIPMLCVARVPMFTDFSFSLCASRSSTLLTGAIIGLAVAVALGALAATVYTHRRDCASADMTEIDEDVDSASETKTKDAEDNDRASRPITPAQVAPDVDLFDASPIDRVQQNNWTAVEVIPAGDPTVRAAFANFQRPNLHSYQLLFSLCLRRRHNTSLSFSILDLLPRRAAARFGRCALKHGR
jgi:hypothetical protein